MLYHCCPQSSKDMSSLRESERGQLFTQMDRLMESKSRSGECRKNHHQWNSYTFQHGASKTDQKLADNLLLPPRPQAPFLDIYSSGYPPVIIEPLLGEVGNETDVWMDGPLLEILVRITSKIYTDVSGAWERRDYFNNSDITADLKNDNFPQVKCSHSK